MAENTDGEIKIEVDLETEKAKQGAVNLSQDLKKSLQQVASESGKTTSQLQQDIDKVAQKYQKQGFTISESYKKAYEDMGISSQQSMQKQISAAEKVQQAQEKALNAISKVAKAVVVAGATAITAVATAGLKFNADMEQYIASFSTMLGDSERAVEHLNDLKEMAKKTPFGVDGLAKASTLLQSFGLSVAEVAPTLRQLGDISQGNKEKFQGLALVFAQVKSQGKLMGNDLYQFINNGFNPLQEIAEKTGKTMAELRDEMSQGKITYEMVASAIKSATSEGGRFAGAMESQSKTLKGQLATLKDNFNEVSGQIMKPLSEMLTNELLPKMIRFVESIDGEKVSRQVKDILDAFVALSPVIAGATTGLTIFVSVLGFSALVKKLGEAWAVFNAILLANPILAVVSALLILGTTLGVAISNANETSRAVEHMSNEYEKAKIAIDETEKKQLEQADSIEKLSQKVISLNKKLKEGNLTEEDAAVAKAELKEAVDKLNNSIPGLNVEIDNETGHLATQEEQVYNLANAYVNLMRTKAKADAYQQKLTEIEKNKISLQDTIAEKENLQFNFLTEDTFWGNVGKTANLLNPFAERGAFDLGFLIEDILDSPQKIDAFNGLKAAKEELKILEQEEKEFNEAFNSIQTELFQAQEDYDKMTQGGISTGKNGGFGTGEDLTAKYAAEQKALKNKLALDEITEKQYYTNLAKMRDKYLQEGTDEYIDASIQIHNYNKQSATQQNSATKLIGENENKEFEKQRNDKFKLLKNSLDLEQITEDAYYKQLEQLRDEYYTEDTDEYRQYTVELFKYNKSVQQALLKEQEKTQDKLVDNISKVNQEKIQLEKKYAEDVLKIQEELNANVTALESEYDTQLQQRANDIYNSFNLFDKPETEKANINTLAKNLKSQLKVYSEYSNAIQTLKDRGVGNAFIDELEGMGVNAVDEIKAMAKASDTKLDEYVSLWAEKHKFAKEEAEKQLAPLKTSTDKMIEQLQADAQTSLNLLNEEYEKGLGTIEETITTAITEYVPQMSLLGENLADGIINGLISKDGELSQTMSSLIRNAVDNAKAEFEIHSPSRVMRDEVGLQLGSGLEIGLIQSLKNIDVSAILSQLRNSFIQQFTPSAVYSAGEKMQTNNITIQNGGSTAILEIDGNKIGKAIFPLIQEQSNIRGVNLAVV